MLIVFCIIRIKNYFLTGLEDILDALKVLIKKEVTYIENFKKDKNSEKEVKFAEIIQSSSRRLNLELAILKLFNESCIKNFEESRDDHYITPIRDIINLLLEIFDKSTDNINMIGLIIHIRNHINFIIDNESSFGATFEKRINKFNNLTAESFLEKIINVLMNLLRKNPNDEELCESIILTLMEITKYKTDKCNIMVKSGCPRLLLQITENTNNSELTKNSLKLIKIISLSSEENLQMVSSQNILDGLYEIYTKFSNNEELKILCESIMNELMKLPGQEKSITDIVLTNLKYIRDCVSDNTIENDNKYDILHAMEKINAFCNCEKYSQMLIDGEFMKDVNLLIDLTINDTDISELNEKLLHNELSLLSKIHSRHDTNKSKLIEGILANILHIMKDKTYYRDIYINSAKILRTNINNERVYNSYLKDKLDSRFVDLLFETAENYIDDLEVSREINNILCSLCLKNEGLSLYIVQKGGLVNIIDELKSLVGHNDEVSRSIKTNGLKFIHSLVKDKTNMETFIKINSGELINNLIKYELNTEEVDRYPYATIDTFNLNVTEPECVKDEITYCMKIIHQTIKQGHEIFTNIFKGGVLIILK
jgi:hypothetical protein